jgi:uncharacterized protein with PIN domain
VTLFAFGRTIHCTCGRRVGLEARLRTRCPGSEADPPRFAADAMLGRLARWLRLLGFDCWYEAHVADETLVRRALEERRVVLTRDRSLPVEWRIDDVLVLVCERPFEQLREVVSRFDLARRARPLTRCSRCNAVLVEADAAGVGARVPPRVLATHAAFRRCPACDRVYWEGTHVQRIRRVIDALDAGDAAPPT